VATLSQPLVPPGTASIRRVAMNLYNDKDARIRLSCNLQALIRTSKSSADKIAEKSGCSEVTVRQAENGQLIPYDDVVLLAVHFRTRALTLLSEDVASRVDRS
jgi:hypothetical protein